MILRGRMNRLLKKTVKNDMLSYSPAMQKGTGRLPPEAALAVL